MALSLVLAIGVLSIYSVTGLSPTSSSTKGAPLYLKQIYWIVVGGLAFLMSAWVNYRGIIRYAYAIYGITVFLLVLVPLIGRSGMGAQRWIAIGNFSFQPSELAKIGTLLAMAKYFSDHYPEDGLTLRELLVPSGILLLPMILIMKQPDLGTALSILSIFLSMIFIIGFHSRFLVYSILLSVMSFPFIGLSIWTHLKTYQRERILTFMNPSSDPTGTGYQIIQSKIAIGSGGFFGKGFLGGTQSQLRFLPERHTDFIFSVLAEQWGFIGVATLFILFFLIILWAIEVAAISKDISGSLISIGVIGLIFFYFFVNVGMTLGVMPVVGVPLPLISYGGSAMVTTLAMLGLLLNIKLRRWT